MGKSGNLVFLVEDLGFQAFIGLLAVRVFFKELLVLAKLLVTHLNGPVDVGLVFN